MRADANGEVIYGEGFDIVANEIAILPGAKVDPFRARLEQGIADTNAESLLNQSEGKTANPGDILASAGSAALIRHADDPALSNLSADARARIAADLSKGYVVLLPKGTSQPAPSVTAGHDDVCWWRVDPTTGDTLGIGGNGWGPSMAEYALMMLVAFSVVTFGCLALARSVGGPLTDRDMIMCIGFGVAAAAVVLIAACMFELGVIAGGEAAGGAGGAAEGAAGGAGGAGGAAGGAGGAAGGTGGAAGGAGAGGAAGGAGGGAGGAAGGAGGGINPFGATAGGGINPFGATAGGGVNPFGATAGGAGVSPAASTLSGLGNITAILPK